MWDTALSVVALSDAGLPREHPALVRAGEWLLGEEVRVPGDWRVRRPSLRPGGWAFEFANDNYPDVDDTAEVVLALLRLGDAPRARAGHALSQGNGSAEMLRSKPFAGEQAFSPGNGSAPTHEPAPFPEWQRDRRLREAIERAASWTKGMQSREGAWGAFDADNTRSLVRELPFLDFGEVIDEPSADVTAHAVEMLAALGRAGDPETVAAVRWLIERQEPGGSWFGRWGVNHVYGTGAVLPALVAAGVAPSEPCIRRAVAWLERHQKATAGGARTRAPTITPSGSGAARAPPRRRPGRCLPCTPPASARRRSPRACSGSWTPSARTAAGTSRSTQAPAFLATTTSTITSIGSCSP